MRWCGCEQEAKRYRGELEIAKAEIATLTEQRDRAMACLQEIADMEGTSELTDYEFAKRTLAITAAALDTPSSPSLPESPIGAGTAAEDRRDTEDAAVALAEGNLEPLEVLKRESM